MNIVNLLAIFTLFIGPIGFAQDEDATNDEEKNKKEVKVYISPDEQLIAPTIMNFKGEKASLIDWERLDEKKFLDLDLWRVGVRIKQKQPRWRRNLQERRLKEKVGYVLECVGQCRLFRGLGDSEARFLTTIREGDELQTRDGSFVWVYLLDGTLVRLSPRGSITFKEFNIGKKQNFVFLRLNSGNTLVWSRTGQKFKEKQIKETDSLFYPLSFSQANPPDRQKKLNDEDIFAFLENSNDTIDKYKRLNALIENNSQFTQKKTEYFFVMPNGSLKAKEVVAEFIVLTGNTSYFKLRQPEQVGILGDEYQPEGTFYFRGFNNKGTESVTAGNWYEIDPKGRNLSERPKAGVFAMGEFVTHNIPTILIARELLFKKYSLFSHEDLTERELAEEYGYRQWEDSRKANGDFAQRIKFLIEYTRRVETTNLLVAEQFKKKLEKSGEKWNSSEYTQEFYRKAMGDFYNYREGASIFTGVKESLNSERKAFWKKLKARKKR